jgi:acetyltransferase-like isoleucine patch superfamily enzyme
MISTIERNWESILSKIKIKLLSLEGAKIGIRVKLCLRTHIPRFASGIKIGDGSSLDRNVVLLIGKDNTGITDPVIEIGNNVYINRNTILDATKKIFIGSETMIGANCYITDHDHAFQNHPARHTISQLPLSGSDTVIEENVWIGSNVSILKGVKIGAHAVIGAGSVVTRSIPSLAVAVGNPCRVIKMKK